MDSDSTILRVSSFHHSGSMEGHDWDEQLLSTCSDRLSWWNALLGLGGAWRGWNYDL